MKDINENKDAVKNKANIDTSNDQKDNKIDLSSQSQNSQKQETSPLKEESKKITINVNSSDIARKRLLNEDIDFVTDSRTALLGKVSPFVGLSLYILAGFIFTLIVWFSLANIDEVTSGIGKIVPSSQVQIIQNLEGGILTKIYVQEGETVKQGQILAKLDDIYFKSQYQEGYSKYISLLAMIARFTAEFEDKKQITFPLEALSDDGLVKLETNLFKSRQKTFKENVKNMQRSYQLVTNELKITEPLAAQKVISQIELLRLQREATNIKTKLENYQNKHAEQTLTDLIKARGNLSSLQEDLIALKDRMERTSLYSPVNGIVKQVYLNTVGGVLRSAVPIMEIVPIDDKLVVEAQISPSDIGFIKVGQKANVKITAYEYSVYGGLDGSVVRVSADTTVNKIGNSFYEVEVETEKNHLGDNKNSLKIIPGMTASVDILTGKRTVLNYILKPIFRAKEKALRER